MLFSIIYLKFEIGYIIFYNNFKVKDMIIVKN